MMKVVLKVALHDDRIQTKAMKVISGFSGVESLSVDKKDQKFTFIGDIDPVKVVRKLEKLCHVEIVSVGPAKEEKKEEPKIEEKKKDEKELIAELLKTNEAYYYHMRMAQSYPYHCYRTVEEGHNGCVIC
ncbi:hypothetical protein TanjilG_20161 [Lupinus angustifolius]|uniref:HMA domain-containing protein n=1 Tax=Lupinus angustifolius TaxID=3871 RepID=A0A4P1RD72_LUPAN|nr:PREDICTED: heavy metal-associated isoprenylated plant protein 39-like [Lupinus angustifolius]OIW08060.1 hypothetical protein TanjilG_20161 [Lupinus angustifolius]